MTYAAGTALFRRRTPAVMFFSKHKTEMPSPEDALPGRSTPMPVPDAHFVQRHARSTRRSPRASQQAVFGMGCFWGAERVFWQTPGVYTTAVGYAGGYTPNPTYEEVCSGRTGHTEVVLVVFDPNRHLLRGAAEGVLGEPRPDPGHAPGQRRRHAVPLGDLHVRRGAAEGRRGVARRVPGRAASGRATATSRPRSRTPGPSTTPRTTTSSTSARTRTATAASAEPACRARWGSRRPSSRLRRTDGQRGGIRIAPSRRIVSPLSIRFSTTCRTSAANSAGSPSRFG